MSLGTRPGAQARGRQDSAPPVPETPPRQGHRLGGGETRPTRPRGPSRRGALPWSRGQLRTQRHQLRIRHLRTACGLNVAELSRPPPRGTVLVALPGPPGHQGRRGGLGSVCGLEHDATLHTGLEHLRGSGTSPLQARRAPECGWRQAGCPGATAQHAPAPAPPQAAEPPSLSSLTPSTERILADGEAGAETRAGPGHGESRRRAQTAPRPGSQVG